MDILVQLQNSTTHYIFRQISKIIKFFSDENLFMNQRSNRILRQKQGWSMTFPELHPFQSLPVVFAGDANSADFGLAFQRISMFKYLSSFLRGCQPPGP
jgi:hypothetical protein